MADLEAGLVADTGGGVGGGIGGGSGGGAGGPTIPALRSGFDLPPAGETRFTRQVILDIAPLVSTPTLDAMAARHDMTRIESRTFQLLGRTLHLWRLDGAGSPWKC